ncbi:MAG TPA: four helix bundle protein [Vicinamibacterales bacterium]|nr:four helix bundle protein [Vicinamibacterales bacterium]
MTEILNHRDLEAWRVNMDGVLETYRISNDFPKSETYGLTSQMRRAAVSVPSNIAEGHARKGQAAINHLTIAIGSLAELDTELEVAVRLAYVSRERAANLQKLIVSGRRLAYGLRRAKRRNLALAVATPVVLVSLAIRVFTWM